MLNANDVPQTGGSKYPPQEPKEVGSYPARLVKVINRGLFPQDPFKDPETGEERERNPQHILDVTYELVDEFLLDEDGNEMKDKPLHISENFAFYNLSSDRAKSTKRYRALDPQNNHKGSWAALLGAPVMVGLTIGKPNQKGISKNWVGEVSPMTSKAAAKLPELVNEPKIFDADNPDMEVFWTLPAWLQKEMKQALNYEGTDFQKLVEMGPSKSASETVEVDAADLDEGEW